MSEADTATTAATTTATAPVVVQQQPVCAEADSLSDKNASVPPSNPMDELDTDEETQEGAVVESSTPATAEQRQGSPDHQSPDSTTDEVAVPTTNPAAAACAEVAPPTGQEVGQGEATAAVSPVKEAKKQERKEEKKKLKKKEDKGIEYILRALSSLQSPEEKLAALCKKFADLNEEHRVLQTSFKTQQRTMTMVMREKDQLQADHTRAVMAKGKLENLCRELQKNSKAIKEESIKRAKEDDEKRKEISAQFNSTIGEIQAQMNDNTERNTKLRQENENLAAQLKAFINSIELRDQQVDKLQKHHELEKKLFEAKLKQAEAILSEHTEKTNAERELIMLKLAESTKKNTVMEAQVTMFKERYAEFESLHTRSAETFQKYKTEMDKMTKRIKKLEKDGLQWRSKWENTNKALVEQVEARGKAESETATQQQKTRKLESLCRALQAELHKKKVAEETDTAATAVSATTTTPTTTTTSASPPNSPEAPEGSTNGSTNNQQQPTESQGTASSSTKPSDSPSSSQSPSPSAAATSESVDVENGSSNNATLTESSAADESVDVKGQS